MTCGGHGRKLSCIDKKENEKWNEGHGEQISFLHERWRRLRYGMLVSGIKSCAATTSTMSGLASSPSPWFVYFSSLWTVWQSDVDCDYVCLTWSLNTVSEFPNSSVLTSYWFYPHRLAHRSSSTDKSNFGVSAWDNASNVYLRAWVRPVEGAAL